MARRLATWAGFPLPACKFNPFFPTPWLAIAPSVCMRRSILSSNPWGFLTWIRKMAGGPRTFPGGVSKWKWKRMLEKKAKKIEMAKLRRERRVYEIRRQAEQMAVSPERRCQQRSGFRPLAGGDASADEQIRRLVSRFQKAGAVDLWSDADGPERLSRVEASRPEGTAATGVRSLRSELKQPRSCKRTVSSVKLGELRGNRASFAATGVRPLRSEKNQPRDCKKNGSTIVNRNPILRWRKDSFKDTGMR
eukprot:c20881_g1_i1 orf=55-801(+)